MKINYENKAMKKNCEELKKQIKRKGGNLRCFGNAKGKCVEKHNKGLKVS